MATLTKTLQSAHPLLLGLLVSALATAVSFLAPEEHAGSLVGLVFLAAAYAFALSKNAPLPPASFGLSLGGLLELAPLRAARILKESSRALLIATGVALVVLPPFWIGFEAWYSPSQDFSWNDALDNGSNGQLINLWDLALGHLLVVALPEEVFFRGYLQSALAGRDRKTIRLLGAEIGVSLIVVSLLFALGHFATTLSVGRLAVFFPSLLFGWLRARTGGVGASIFLHAQCNVFSALLGQGFGLY